MPKFDHPNFGDLSRYSYEYATVTAIYGEDDTVDITMGESPYTAIPLFYHCNPDSEQRENGALMSAATAFSVDDEVIVRCSVDEEGTITPVHVVAISSGLRKCLTEYLVFGLTLSSQTYCIVWDLGNRSMASITADSPKTLTELETWFSDKEKVNFTGDIWTSAFEGEIHEKGCDPLQNGSWNEASHFSYGAPMLDTYSFTEYDYGSSWWDSGRSRGLYYRGNKTDYFCNAILGYTDTEDIGSGNSWYQEGLYQRSRVLTGVVGTAAEGEQNQLRFETTTDAKEDGVYTGNEAWISTRRVKDINHKIYYKVWTPIATTEKLVRNEIIDDDYYWETWPNDTLEGQYTRSMLFSRGFFDCNVYKYTPKSAIQLYIWYKPNATWNYYLPYVWDPDPVITMSYGESLVVNSATSYRVEGDADLNINPNEMSRDSGLETAIEGLFSWYTANVLGEWDNQSMPSPGTWPGCITRYVDFKDEEFWYNPGDDYQVTTPFYEVWGKPIE